MPVIIHDGHGSVTIPDHVISTFELVIGPINLILQGQAFGDIGKQIIGELSKYKQGDEVQIIDEFKYQYSGVYKIVTWNLTSTGTRYGFDLGFRKLS